MRRRVAAHGRAGKMAISTIHRPILLRVGTGEKRGGGAWEFKTEGTQSLRRAGSAGGRERETEERGVRAGGACGRSAAGGRRREVALRRGR